MLKKLILNTDISDYHNKTEDFLMDQICVYLNLSEHTILEHFV